MTLYIDIENKMFVQSIVPDRSVLPTFSLFDFYLPFLKLLPSLSASIHSCLFGEFCYNFNHRVIFVSSTNIKFRVIAVELAVLTGLYCLLACLYPDGLVIHKTGSVADSFAGVPRLYLTCGMWSSLFLLPAGILLPFVKRKSFNCILLSSVIFCLYLFGTLIVEVLSLNMEGVLLAVLAYLLLFFVPILGFYLLIYVIVFCCENK